MTTEGRNIFVAGQTGTGKTYYVRHAIAQARRYVVYQTKREDTSYPGVVFDGMADGRSDWRLMLAWWHRCRSAGLPWRLVYRPRDKWDVGEFDRLCRMVYAAGDCVLVAEEIAAYLTGRLFQTTGRGTGIKSLLTAGRTRGVVAYWITQRCHNIPREVTSESREAALFALREPSDIEYVRERFGYTAAARMALLQRYQYVHWREGGSATTYRAEIETV